MLDVAGRHFLVMLHWQRIRYWFCGLKQQLQTVLRGYGHIFWVLDSRRCHGLRLIRVLELRRECENREPVMDWTKIVVFLWCASKNEETFWMPELQSKRGVHDWAVETRVFHTLTLWNRPQTKFRQLHLPCISFFELFVWMSTDFQHWLRFY